MLLSSLSLAGVSAGNSFLPDSALDPATPLACSYEGAVKSTKSREIMVCDGSVWVSMPAKAVISAWDSVTGKVWDGSEACTTVNITSVSGKNWQCGAAGIVSSSITLRIIIVPVVSIPIALPFIRL